MILSYLGTSAILPPKRRGCLVWRSRAEAAALLKAVRSKRGSSGQRLVSPQQRVSHGGASAPGLTR